VRNIALTIKNIALIVRYECDNDTESYYRDLWLFSYLCNGANIADLCNLKFENVKRDNLEFYRQKTLAKSKIKKAVVAYLTPEMKGIINKWGNKKQLPANYIFPILKGKESSLEKRSIIKSVTRSINHYLTKIGQHLGIGNISTYTARHSFATVLKRSGSNIAFISESLGHSNLKITENYLASFEDEERQKNASLLTDFTNLT
jgi:integrase